MGKIYCGQCGAKNEYNLTRPSFCASCGNPLGSAVKPNINKIQNQPDVSIDEDSSDVLHVPNIRNLSYEVDFGEKNQFRGRDIIEESIQNGQGRE